jgi:hypothetical protein
MPRTACARSRKSAGPSGRSERGRGRLIRQDFGTLADLIGAPARHQPTPPALVQDERALDFAVRDAAMAPSRPGLQRDGPPTGAAIAVCARNFLECDRVSGC